MPDSAEYGRCQLTAYDQDDEPTWQCERLDGRPTMAGDGGELILCPKHASWATAMGSSDA